MNFINQANFIGQLLSLSTTGVDVLEYINLRRKDKAVSDNIISGWKKFTITSNTAWTEEDEFLDPPYTYNFILRQVQNRFLIVSTKLEYVNNIVKNIRNATEISRPFIKINELVEDLCAGTSSKYRLGTVYANVDGYGRSLRSISLYGDNLTDAEMFLDMRDKLTPHRIHLRSINTGYEILSISTAGEISFYYSQLSEEVRIQSIEDALIELKLKNYINWPST